MSGPDVPPQIPEPVPGPAPYPPSSAAPTPPYVPPAQPYASTPYPPAHEQGQYAPPPGYAQQYPQAPYPAPYPTPQPAPRPGNGLAVAGFVLGLLGFLGSFIPVINFGAIALGVLGAILAGIGIAKAQRSGTGKGLAVAGIVLGLLGVVLSILINALFVHAVDGAVDKATGVSISLPPVSDDGTQVGADDQTDSSDQAAGDQDAATQLGASRENPAPIGSSIVGTDWVITVNAVSTATVDSFDQAPQAGSVLLVVNLTATYTGNESQGATPWASVDFVTADGTTLSTIDSSSLFIPEEQFDSLTSLYNGGSVTGNWMIEVPADTWQAGVLAVSPDLFSDKTFVAVQ